MHRVRRIDFDLPDFSHQEMDTDRDKRGVRLGLAIAGGALGGSLGLLAVLSVGMANDNPIGWVAIIFATAIGSVLGA